MRLLAVFFDFENRGERIRTSDLSVPNRALYQAEPRPAKEMIFKNRSERGHLSGWVSGCQPSLKYAHLLAFFLLGLIIEDLF